MDKRTAIVKIGKELWNISNLYLSFHLEIDKRVSPGGKISDDVSVRKINIQKLDNEYKAKIAKIVNRIKKIMKKENVKIADLSKEDRIKLRDAAKEASISPE